MNDTFQSLAVGVVVSTYNRPDALRLVLQSIVDQSLKPRCVVVSDDGSGSETWSAIESFKSTLPLVHVWQPDNLFRLSRARNLGVLAADVDYLIFIDGDCVLPPDFVSSHVRLARKNALVFGSRKLLSKTDTESVLKDGHQLKQVYSWFSGRKFVKIGLGLLRTIPRRHWSRAKGFTLAIFKENLLQIGGFDESYRHWGLEDSDFAVRCLRSGLILKDGRYATSCLHLWHQEKGGADKSPNQHKFQLLIDKTSTCLPSNSCLRQS